MEKRNIKNIKENLVKEEIKKCKKDKNFFYK